jgi:hypothetical protein
MLTFSGITFDVAAAINIAIGGIIAVIGGLVAARIRAKAAREAANQATSVQVKLARAADLRERRRTQVDPVLTHTGRVVSGYGRILRLAHEGKGTDAERRFRHLLDEVDDFDLTSVYVGAGEDFASMFHGFLEYEAGARAKVQQCVAIPSDDQRSACIARELPLELFKLTPMLANLHRAANRYTFAEDEQVQP